MSKTVLTVHLDPQVQLALDALAAMLDQSHSWVIEQALQDYTQHHAWQVQAIEEGLASLNQGHGIPHAAVQRRLSDKIGTDS
jgi:predicted transcriptional regulator